MKQGTTTFMEHFRTAAARNHSYLCVGLDPDPARIDGGDVVAWSRTVIDATSDLVCAYKPNIAFFEALGLDGHRVLRQVIDAVPDDVPILLDAKRGDIASTAEAYARSLFDVLGAAAITVSPYLGEDAVRPFAERPDRGVFVLARTSNPGARDLQDLLVTDADEREEPLYLAVARKVLEWNTNGNMGLVAGATYPDDIARLRELCPDLPFLVPGVGAQSGDLTAAVQAANGPGGFLINASRAVIYAGVGNALPGAARSAATSLRDAINAALEQGQGTAVP